MPIDPDVQLELDNISDAITTINTNISSLQSQLTTLSSTLATTMSDLAATTADLGDTKDNLETSADSQREFLKTFVEIFSPDVTEKEADRWHPQDEVPPQHPISRFPNRNPGEF